MGAGMRSETYKTCGDSRPPGPHEGDAVRAVLLVVPQGGLPAARAPRPRRVRRAAAPAARAPVHLLAPPQQPHRQAAPRAQRLQRHQHAHGAGLPGRQRARGGLRRQEEEDGPQVRGRLVHAVRPVVPRFFDYRELRQMLILPVDDIATR